jgi:signal transduction histidine kinase
LENQSPREATPPRELRDGVQIEVVDRGIGIASEDLPRICEPFYRADPSRTRATGGLGLGLALAKRIVEAHQGSLAIESALGAGTLVRLWLPRAPKGRQRGAQGPPPAPRAGTPTHRSAPAESAIGRRP